jgi:hypothetical protein
MAKGNRSQKKRNPQKEKRQTQGATRHPPGFLTRCISSSGATLCLANRCH